jgi:preprotein translocase subunit YajC
MNLPFLLAFMQPAPGGGGSAMTGLLVQMVAIFAIFYFIVIRPQQKQRKAQENALLALKKGDEIVTTGGIVAHVMHIQQHSVDGKSAPSLEDLITIRSGDTRLIVERGRIARVKTKEPEAQPNA